VAVAGSDVCYLDDDGFVDCVHNQPDQYTGGASDSDEDGIPDDVDWDDDNDGVPDVDEIANGTDPLNPDSDNDGEGDATDPFPNDDTETTDADTDDDNDGVHDVDDAFPFDPIGDCDCAKSQGVWKSEFKKADEDKTKGRKFDDASLLEFLTIVGFATPTSMRGSPSALSLTPTAS
jgi:hypothetical protein